MKESSLSLLELNRQVKGAIRELLPGTYWLRAETSDVRSNQSGHCYLEFVEKDPVNQTIIAKARGVIWANVYRMLSPYFLQETGQAFASGLNVLVRVTVDFHELYGYSLTVVDIDPSFTLGEIARNRQRVLKQLEEDGVLSLNKELEMPELPNRVAVISSPTAAGFEDFNDQLQNNPAGILFYTKLFPAIMQGERSEESIIAALEKIYQHKEHFDAVAIIRGGGASSDLSTFDSYHLAANVAQFPLPVVSGIGHERDVTVLDVVAHTRGKTPTAVAEVFIALAMKSATEVMELQEHVANIAQAVMFQEQSDLLTLSNALVHRSTLFLQRESATVQTLTMNTRHLFRQALQQEIAGLQQTSSNVKHFIKQGMRDEATSIKQTALALQHAVRQKIREEVHVVNSLAQFVHMVSPQNILKRGYTLSLKEGKVITSIADVKEGDTLETLFKDGAARSLVTTTKNKK